MFLTEPQGDKPLREQQSPVKKMSDALRRGIELVPGIHQSQYWEPDPKRCGACAVATALVGHYGSYAEAFALRHSKGSTSDTISEVFGVPWGTVIEASHKYESGASRAAIADWLEGQGY